MAEDNYPVRYTAFLDILGFRELVINLNKDPALIPEVCNLLRHVHRPNVDGFRETFANSDLRAQSISDAVAISSSATAAGLAHMFVAIELLAIKLLEAGYFVRGAIVKGKLFHDSEMVFGDGIVRAYHFESTVARFPRIMLPREIATDASSYVKENQFAGIFETQVRRSQDGPQYLHVLRRFEAIKELKADDPQRAKLLKRLVLVRNHIQRRLDEAVDNPAHFEKVHWFADYWNGIFYGVEGLDRVEGAGLEILLSAG